MKMIMIIMITMIIMILQEPGQVPEGPREWYPGNPGLDHSPGGGRQTASHADTGNSIK